MKTILCKTKTTLGQKAAAMGAALINEAITKRGTANIILATGASQFEMLASLVREQVDWPVVTAFHLDEYIDLPVSHPASFRRYLKERFADKVPLKKFHYINGEGDIDKECRRLASIIARHPIDVAFVGIGENGHLAFNDPPADFETEAAFIPVELDEQCRRQQLGEGWFSSIEEVPLRAISMSVRQILQADNIICCVPDARKAAAVRKVIQGKPTPDVPASILQHHDRCTLFLDRHSAKGLK